MRGAPLQLICLHDLGGKTREPGNGDAADGTVAVVVNDEESLFLQMARGSLSSAAVLLRVSAALDKANDDDDDDGDDVDDGGDDDKRSERQDRARLSATALLNAVVGVKCLLAVNLKHLSLSL